MLLQTLDKIKLSCQKMGYIFRVLMLIIGLNLQALKSDLKKKREK